MENAWLTFSDLMKRWEMNEPTLAQYLLDKRLPFKNIRKYEDLRSAVSVGPKGWNFLGDFNDLGDIMRDRDALLFSVKHVIEMEKNFKVRPEAEEFVRELRVSVECDTDINFQPFKRQKSTFSHAAMGFHYSTSKEWKALCDIIRDGKFSCGEAAYLGAGKNRDRIKFYDQSQKLLQIINKKLLAFLTKTYGIEFPKKYKIFDRRPGDRPRVYSPKFQTDKHQRDGNLEEVD